MNNILEGTRKRYGKYILERRAFLFTSFKQRLILNNIFFVKQFIGNNILLVGLA
jgi:hypothetical protein